MWGSVRRQKGMSPQQQWFIFLILKFTSFQLPAYLYNPPRPHEVTALWGESKGAGEKHAVLDNFRPIENAAEIIQAGVTESTFLTLLP